LTPTQNKHGTVQIMLVVSDGASSATRSFSLTVESVNDAPTISEIADQFIREGGSTDEIDVLVTDVDGAGDLTLTATSTSQALLPDGAITFGGSGTDRTIKLTPASGEFGSAEVTVTVSDGEASATTSFTLNVSEDMTPSEKPDAGEMPPDMVPDAGEVDEPEEDAATPPDDVDEEDEVDPGSRPRLRIKKGGCSVSDVQTSEPAPKSLLGTFLGVFAFVARRRRRR
jgi:MYXO-CTERM domain-containing protein